MAKRWNAGVGAFAASGAISCGGMDKRVWYQRAFSRVGGCQAEVARSGLVRGLMIRLVFFEYQATQYISTARNGPRGHFIEHGLTLL
jgi:hypothetical protein